ncbi:hypothetical protein Cassandra_0157 [Pseudomonas phage Cassandra]|nr:hypothetical protein Cassandra_0157 [Pseudomonas phage Cassandra]WPK39354.1 hypothetical protein Deiofobo_0157 [Pseudomonas phage Deifobo]WPK40387.1 hypothetical protein Paride_0157 [Pseudomonas phage Paride]
MIIWYSVLDIQIIINNICMITIFYRNTFTNYICQ